MKSRTQFYLITTLGALAGYLFVTIASTGQLNLLWTGAFIVLVPCFTYIMEKIITWAEKF